MTNKFYSVQFKYEVVIAYKNEYFSVKELCNRYRISRDTLYIWVKRFEKDGISAFEDSKHGSLILKS